jgi:hypothetical protein
MQRLDASTRWLWLLAALWSLAGCTCSDDAEQRREILKPEDRAKARAEAVDKRRYTTPEGELRASEEEVAGLLLPRGLSLHREFPHEWYFRTLHRDVSLKRLEAYFRPQLVTLKLERDATGGVHFIDAQLQKDPTAQQVSVRIAPVLTGVGQNEVYIRQRPPSEKKAFPSAAEAEAKLEAMRKHAD